MESTVAEQSANAIGNWNRFQILSLDGGGFKGLFSAAVLAKLEEKSGAADH